MPLSAFAHKAWLQPSQTVIAGTNPWITVDAAVSNDLFYFNHVPLRLDNLAITAPDGSKVAPINTATGKYRSVFDLELKQQGTYRIGTLNSGLNARFQLSFKFRPIGPSDDRIAGRNVPASRGFACPAVKDGA